MVSEAGVTRAEVALEPDHVAAILGIWVLSHEPTHTGGVLLADTAEDAEIGGGVLFFIEVGDANHGYVIVCGDFTEGSEKTSDGYVVIGIGFCTHVGGIGVYTYEFWIWSLVQDFQEHIKVACFSFREIVDAHESDLAIVHSYFFTLEDTDSAYIGLHSHEAGDYYVSGLIFGGEQDAVGRFPGGSGGVVYPGSACGYLSNHV